MKKTVYSLLLLGLLGSVPLSAQAQRYVKEMHDMNDPQITNVSTCVQGNYHYTSHTVHRPGGQSDIHVTCLDSLGHVLWNRVYFDGNIPNGFSGKMTAGPDALILVGSEGTYNGEQTLTLLALDYQTGNIIEQVYYYPFGGNVPVMYGFDVVYDPADNTYVLAGSGAYAPSGGLAGPRFAWAMKVHAGPGNKDHVVWDHLFESNPGDAWYDGFNNIEIVPGPNGNQYHLSGTASYPSPSAGTQLPMVNNVLLDTHGAVIWSAPFTSPSSIAGNLGMWNCDALYNSNNNTVVMLYYSEVLKNAALVYVDAMTGNVVSAGEVVLQPFGAGTGRNIPFNMAWSDPGQTAVTISGMSSFANQSYLVNVDPINGAPNWHYTYPGTFDMADLTAINYDFVTRPGNTSSDRVFFAPNALTVDLNAGRNFFGGLTNPSGQNFQNLDIRTNLDGTHPLGCEQAMDFDSDLIPGWMSYTSNIDSPIHMLGYHVHNGEDNVAFFENYYCASVKPAGVRTTASSEAIRLYPNPARESSTLDWGVNTVEEIMITDVAGRMVQRISKPEGSGIELKTAGWSAGTYQVSIRTTTGNRHLSFVKL